MEENRTWEADNYWIELLKKYNRSKLEELRKEKAEKMERLYWILRIQALPPDFMKIFLQRKSWNSN